MVLPKSTFFSDINKTHPDPYQWAAAEKIRQKTRRTVLGCLDEVGENHNTFVTAFKGIQVPLDKLTVLGPGSSPLLGDFEAEVYKYGALFLHLTVQDRSTGAPALLTCAAGKSATVIIALYQFKVDSERPLAEIRDNFPAIYRMLEDIHITRLTTSYDVLKPCLSKHLGARIGRDLIDLLHLASINRPRDFAALEAIRRPTENLALQTFVWSYVGVQKGPMPAENHWQRFQDAPWDEARHTLHRFVRGTPLTPQQLLWQYQIMKAGVVTAAHVVRQNARETEKDWGEEQMPAVYSAGLHRFQSQHNLAQESYFSGLQKERGYSYREPEAPQPMLPQPMRGNVPTRVSVLTPLNAPAQASFRRSGPPTPSPMGGPSGTGHSWSERSRHASSTRPPTGPRYGGSESDHGLRKAKRRSSSPARGHGPPKRTAYQLGPRPRHSEAPKRIPSSTRS